MASHLEMELGGTVKRFVARASLQRPLSKQIINFDSLHKFVMENISTITFFCISSEYMVQLRSIQKLRFQLGKTIPGTRSFHFFQPTDHRTLKFKRTSIDIGLAGEHSFKRIKQKVSTDDIRIMDFVCCKYDGFC